MRTTQDLFDEEFGREDLGWGFLITASFLLTFGLLKVIGLEEMLGDVILGAIAVFSLVRFWFWYLDLT